MTIKEAIDQRLGCKFAPRQWVEGEMYDCVSFCASVFHAIGGIPEISLPENYAVYGKGAEMRDLIISVIESTGKFSEQKGNNQHGDLLVLSLGQRGHHAGICLEGERIAHCVARRGVVIDTMTQNLKDSIHKIYRLK